MSNRTVKMCDIASIAEQGFNLIQPLTTEHMFDFYIGNVQETHSISTVEELRDVLISLQPVIDLLAETDKGEPTENIFVHSLDGGRDLCAPVVMWITPKESI